MSTQYEFPGSTLHSLSPGNTLPATYFGVAGVDAPSHPCLKVRPNILSTSKIALLLVLILGVPAYADHDYDDGLELWMSNQGEIWPTLVEIDLCNAAGNTLPVRFFNRHYSTAEWIADQDVDGDGTPEREWRISRHDVSPAAGEWHLYRDDELVATITNDLWWLQPRVDWSATAGASGTFEALAASTDWGRLDVVMIPIFYGFWAGFILDAVLGVLGFTIRGILRPIASIEFM